MPKDTLTPATAADLINDADADRREWAKWRLVCDRLTSSPRWRYPAPRVLVNCVKLSQEQMGAANTRYWNRQRTQ